MHENTAQVCESLAADIGARGWAVRREFVAAADIVRLRAQLGQWWEEGELRRAGIGRGASFQVREDIRGDYVRWLDFSGTGPFADFVAAHFEPLRLAVNRALFLGVAEYEGHVTVYPPGAFYRRHVDQFRDAAHRKLSVILYLNDDWGAEDGGELRLYVPTANGEEVFDVPPEDGEQFIDVPPEGGTLVAFLSHEIPHEVLPAKRERYSLTGWFRTRD